MAGDIKQFILFQVGRTKALIDIYNIFEIIVKPNQSDIKSIPNSQTVLEGLINLRGEAIPLLDLPKFLGLDAFFSDDASNFGYDEDIVLIIKDHTGKKVGLIVNEIFQVKEVDWENNQIRENTNTVFSSYFPEVVDIDGEITFVLSTKNIFDELKI